MKLFINASTLSGSGVTQVATSFIYECIKFPEHEYFVFASKTVSAQINYTDFPSNFKFYDVPHHPVYGWSGLKTRSWLKKKEREIQPDSVFTVFGPSWWTPKAPNLQGYAYPHYVYPESPFFKKLNVLSRLKIMVFRIVHLYFLKRNGKYFVSETEDVSRRFSKLLNVENREFFTVSNTYNSYFKNFEFTGNRLLPNQENEFRFLTLCTYHPHKNLEILNEIIPLLNKRLPNESIKFVLTIDENNFQQNFTDIAKKSILNIGRIDVKDCPQAYAECNALFLPTLLECFSANYPEAMVMKRPIITSDLTFASTVCKDAAVYFDVNDVDDIVNKLEDIIKKPELREKLVENGNGLVGTFPDAYQRTKKYLEICKKIA